jgi:transposase
VTGSYATPTLGGMPGLCRRPVCSARIARPPAVRRAAARARPLGGARCLGPDVAPLLAAMRTVNQQLAYSERVIEAITRLDARVQRLRTVPSVGPVTAAAFVATIDDAQRFHRAHEVDLGLVPREVSSGETTHGSGIVGAS